MKRDNKQLWPTIILPFALGYFMTFAFRSINAILVHPLTQEFSLSATDLGLITSAYILTYALFQIPAGLLVDTWGPRRITSFFFIIGGIGIIMFGMASSITSLTVARAIIGIGVAAGFVGAIKAVTQNVKTEDIPYYSGIILASGGLGALIVTTPSKLFEIHYGWRELCFLLGIITFIVAFIIFFVVKDNKSDHGKKPTLRDEINGLKTVYSSRFFWRIAPLFIFANGGFIAMQGLWIGPWLQNVVGVTPLQSSFYLMIIAIAMTIGMISGGLISYFADKMNLPLTTIVVIGIFVHVITQIVIISNIFSTNYAVWFIYSLFSQVVLVNYAIVAQHYGAKLSGRALTAVNILIFFFAFVFQYLFGVVIDQWPNISGASHITGGYKVAFIGLVILEIIGLIWYIYYRRPDTEEIA